VNRHEQDGQRQRPGERRQEWKGYQIAEKDPDGGTRLGIWERRLDRTGEWGSPDFALQPGLGVDIFLSRHLAVRVAGDLRLIFRHDQRFDRDYRTTLYRFNTGLVFHFVRD
jgi:hypothetical protein